MAPSSPVVRRIVQIANYIPFVVVLFLFLFGYATLLDIHIRHTWGKHHAFFSALLNILVATALVGGALGCFLLACFRDPGHPVRGDVEDGAAWGAQHTQQQQYEQRGEGSAREDGAGRLQSRHAAEASEAGQAAERFDAADEEDEDEEGPSAPLLSAPRDTPDARGTMALRMLPGAPRLPARTGRRQLDDVMALASIDGSQREGGDGARGKVKLADVQVKSSGERRWCAKCDAPKPDRAHHCSICKVCVLRMDHHCPWLASRCVGLRNHKAFFLFLFYTCLTCCFAAQDAARTLVTWVNEELDGFENSPISWAILLFTSFIFGIALIPFAAYHAWLICRNRTTLESMEGAGRVRIRAQPSAPGRESVTERLQRLHSGSEGGAGNVPSADAALPAWRADAQLTPEERKALKRAGKLNIYNVGVHENWCAIMGHKWYLWFVPVGKPDSDGFSYAVDVKTLRELQRVTEGIRVGADAEQNSRAGTQSRSNAISSIRGRAREASTTDVASSATRMQQPLTQADIASGRIPDTRGRKEGQRTKSAHGVVEWGKPPKRDFVLYGVSDDEDEEGDLRSADPAAQEEEGSDEDGLPRRTESASQADAEVWR